MNDRLVEGVGSFAYVKIRDLALHVSLLVFRAIT